MEVEDKLINKVIKSLYNKVRFECFRHKIIDILCRPLCLFNKHHYMATHVNFYTPLLKIVHIEYACTRCHKKKYLVYNDNTNKFETAYKLNLKEENEDGES